MRPVGVTQVHPSVPVLVGIVGSFPAIPAGHRVANAIEESLAPDIGSNLGLSVPGSRSLTDRIQPGRG